MYLKCKQGNAYTVSALQSIPKEYMQQLTAIEDVTGITMWFLGNCRSFRIVFSGMFKTENREILSCKLIASVFLLLDS